MIKVFAVGLDEKIRRSTRHGITKNWKVLGITDRTELHSCSNTPRVGAVPIFRPSGNPVIPFLDHLVLLLRLHRKYLVPIEI